MWTNQVLREKTETPEHLPRLKKARERGWNLIRGAFPPPRPIGHFREADLGQCVGLQMNSVCVRCAESPVFCCVCLSLCHTVALCHCRCCLEVIIALISCVIRDSCLANAHCLSVCVYVRCRLVLLMSLMLMWWHWNVPHYHCLLSVAVLKWQLWVYFLVETERKAKYVMLFKGCCANKSVLSALFSM